MNTAAVTIAGPDRRVDLVVSTETPLAELIPTFVELSADVRADATGNGPVWSVAPPGREPLPLDRTLGQSERRRRHRAHAHRSCARRRWRRRARRALRVPDAARAARRASAREPRCPRRSAAASRIGVAIKAFFGYEEEPPIVESPEPRGPSATARC